MLKLALISPTEAIEKFDLIIELKFQILVDCREEFNFKCTFMKILRLQ